MMKKPRNWSLKIYLISVLENKKLVVEIVTKLAHRSDRVDGQALLLSPIQSRLPLTIHN